VNGLPLVVLSLMSPPWEAAFFRYDQLTNRYTERDFLIYSSKMLVDHSDGE